jgi:hypothetical protein
MKDLKGHFYRKERKDVLASKRAAVTQFEPLLRFTDDVRGSDVIPSIPVIKDKCSLIQKSSRRILVTLRLDDCYKSNLYRKVIRHFSLIQSSNIIQVDHPDLLHPPQSVAMDGSIFSISCNSSFCLDSYISLRSLNRVKAVGRQQLYAHLLDALNGLEYLHSHGLWHGNINSKAIYIDINSSQV